MVAFLFWKAIFASFVKSMFILMFSGFWFMSPFALGCKAMSYSWAIFRRSASNLSLSLALKVCSGSFDAFSIVIVQSS